MCVTTPSSIRTHPFVCAHARTLSSTSTDAIMFVHPMAWIQKRIAAIISLHKANYFTQTHNWICVIQFMHVFTQFSVFLFLLGILIWFWNFGFIFCNILFNIWFNFKIYSFFWEFFKMNFHWWMKKKFHHHDELN